MSNKKHYIITSITLGAIAAVSAGLVGLTNLITSGQIKKNEQNKILSGISEIFGKTATISQEFEIKDQKYTTYAYQINNEENTLNAYAFKTTGSNMYGKISLIIGFVNSNNVATFEGLSIVVNEQTYATTLVENYINPINDGSRELDDVSCGATYGAKLVRDMVNESKLVAEGLFGE